VVLDEIALGSPDIFKTFETMSCFETLDVPKTSRLKSLLLVLDDGEANAIELAMIKQFPLIIDERKGRQVAQQLGIKVTGFAGLLIQACRSKIIEREEAISLLDQAMENGLRLSDSLQLQVRNKLLDE
jgi:predicted nucleic acid-binding protein